MKLLVAAIFTVLAASAAAEENWDIDWSKVLPVQDMPGFWDGRDIRPAVYPGDMTRTGRIVGGEIVVPNSHPYQVACLMTFGGGTGLCGGSLIDERTVMTAAHCPIGSSQTQVIHGAHQMTIVEPTQQRLFAPAANYRLHAGYNPANLNNDIALILHIAAPVVLNAWVQPSALPPLGNAETFAGEVAIVTGWGRTTDTSGATSPVLRWVDIPVITNAACAAVYGGIVIASTICTSTTGGRGTCNGDSGGPLTVPRAGGLWQIGVVSFGAAAGCEAGFPAGFARVTSFRQWIEDNRFQ